MSIAIISHPAFATHNTGEHPEKAERWEATQARLRQLELDWCEPSAIAPDCLERVHPPEHANRIKAFCEAGGGRIDEDTVASPETFEVALLSAGAAIAAVDLTMTETHQAAVALCRPPGHHALENETMGFCFFNNAALAARHAQAKYGLKRIAIVDWDVHHGNGTEAIFYQDPSVLFLSTHQHPNWPGTGAPEDIGKGAGAGFNVNIQLPVGTGDAGYLQAFTEIFTPIVHQFNPELVIVSAGFDAHWRDPLGNMNLSVSGFAALTREVKGWADLLSGGRIVFLLEGGYDVEALAESMAASVSTLAGRPVVDTLGPAPDPEPKEDANQAIELTRMALAQFWSLKPQSSEV